MKTRATQILITVTMLFLAGMHVLFPDLKIDSATLILLVLAVIPWLLPIVKSVELPGGFKIELQDVKAATQKVTKSAVNMCGRISVRSAMTGRLTVLPSDSVETLKSVGERDPGLAMVGFRIELEKRLRRLAAQEGFRHEGQSLHSLLHEMCAKDILPKEFTEGLSELIALGNQAAHGAEVSPDAAEWLFETAPGILKAIDGLLEDNAKAS